MAIVVLIGYAALVALMSLRPMDGVTIDPWDKLLHFATYAVFAVLAHRAIKYDRHYLYVCLGIVIYGGLLEVAQSHVPGRQMSGYDLLANTMGVVVAAVVTLRVAHSERII